MNEKETQIIEFLNSHNKIYVKIDNDTSMDNIYMLFINNVIFEPTCDIEIYYLGHYYKYIMEDYDTAIKYYLISVDNGNSNAMNNLACHYRHEDANKELMMKYFLMAIEKNNNHAMRNLARYYRDVEKDYVTMVKYYIMAIDAGNKTVLFNLGYHYQHRNICYKLMKQYYLMSLEHGTHESFDNLLIYYGIQQLETLELYMNYPTFIKRKEIIDLFNNISLIDEPINKKNNFYQLFKNFEFNDDDNLSVSLWLLWKNIKN